MGFVLRGFAAKAPELMGTSQPLVDSLLNIQPNLHVDDILIVLSVAALVTTARKGLMSAWPDFAVATNRSNMQVFAGFPPSPLHSWKLMLFEQFLMN